MSRIGTIGTRAAAGLAFMAAASLLSTSAFAINVPTANTGTLSSSPQSYATQAVTAASGAITLAANVSYAVTPAATGTFLITFTLPTGVTFASTPSAAGDGTNCASAVPVTSGGTGSSVTFQATVQKAGACTVTVNSFLVAGATALQSTTTVLGTNLNSAGFNISEQVSGASSGLVGLNEAKSTPIALAASGSELAFFSATSVTQDPTPVIDVSSPSLGTKFQVAAVDKTWVDIGALTYGTNGNLNATATGPYNFPGSSASITLTGNFNGIGSAYLNPPGGVGCATSASTEAGLSNVITGTITGSSVTFANVTGAPNNNPFTSGNNPSVQTQEVCLYATGSNLIGSNPLGFGAAGTISPTTNQADSLPKSALDSYNYNGVVQQFLYAVAGGSYPGYLRIVNGSGNTIQVFASVQADGGSLGTTTVETGLAANNNDLVPVSTIATNAGVTLGAHPRTTLTVFAPGNPCSSGTSSLPGLGSCNVGFSLLEMNPSGDVVMMGSGTAP
jgi:hypothetical protein